MVSGFLTFCLGLTIVVAILTFICFLLVLITNSYLQFYSNEPNAEKVRRWNIRFIFLKTWLWQWMIYIFAFTAFAGIVTSLVTFV